MDLLEFYMGGATIPAFEKILDLVIENVLDCQSVTLLCGGKYKRLGLCNHVHREDWFGHVFFVQKYHPSTQVRRVLPIYSFEVQGHQG